jgi:dihydrodipicolinate synthase/N-acetylneuraminate lyase
LTLTPERAAALRAGLCIPAHPLALDGARRLDERAQRALTRYYLAAGAGGLAVGVHTTQFAIRAHGLLAPVLELAAEEARAGAPRALLVAGVCGARPQALAEAALARELGYDLGLLSLAALPDAPEDALLEHARAVGEVLPLFGFYLQPAVGGRHLSRAFWRRFAALPAVRAIKVAPFDRYRTVDVLRGVAESGRADDVALYTGNDDAIVTDLASGFAGGLLGHWAVWTRAAAELFERVRAARAAGAVPAELLTLGREVTDCNAALFDVAHGFRGCIAGVQHVLHGQGLLASPACLDPRAGLSPGQAAEIARVRRSYPHLVDDEFVAAHRDAWLR